ncbi:30S ribosomal protein S3 [archaeon]|nr:MAG: 30S ribosomal protein S3 [archaeon]
MAIERMFVKEGLREAQIEEFLRQKFDKAGYSHTEIVRTPLGTRIIVYAHKPGLVIGKSGRRVDQITDELKQKFSLDNPLVDVREVENPFMDANIIAYRIARALERGINYKKVCNYYLEEVLKAGAVGIAIRVAGKLAGAERSMFQKFQAGFVAHSGEYSERLVDKGYAEGMLKPGKVGVQVKIMLSMPQEIIEKDLSPEQAIGDKDGSVEEKASA